MNKLFVGSRGLLVITALVLAAGMCTASTARAAPSSPGAGSASWARAADTASPSAQCNFSHSIPSCESTDPTVTLATLAYGDTSSCIFVWDLIWGDGHSTTVKEVAPPDGWKTIAQHTYAAPGVYGILATGTVTGDCALNPFSVTFTLLLNQPPAYSPKVHLSPTSGRQGKLVTLTGSGWAPGGVVQIHLPDKRLFIGITSWRADSHGNWKEPFAVNAAPPGAYKVSFSETSAHLKATGSFTVLDQPTQLERFSNWVDECYHGKLKSDPDCQNAVDEAAHQKISLTSALDCAIELTKGIVKGIAICVIEDGTPVARWIYNLWQLLAHKLGL